MSLLISRSRWLAFVPVVSATVASIVPLAHAARAAEPAPLVSPTPAPMPSELAGPDVTLEALLAHAKTKAPVLALDDANPSRIRAARAAAGRVLPDNPELWVGVGPRLVGGDTGVDFEVGVSQRFEIGGERGVRLKVADAVEKGILAEMRDRHWDLHTTIHGLFYQALVARERVALAMRVVAFQDDIARIVGKQRAAGQVSQLNERVAIAESAIARQELTALVQAELAVRHELALVVGWAPETPPRPIGSLGFTTTLPPLPELIALAAEKRPDLAVLDAAIAEAKARIRAADRDKTPEPTLGVSWTRESAPTGGEPSHVVIATIGMPLPFASNNEPERAAARAELEFAMAERRRAEGQVAAEVTRAYRAAAAATRRLEAFGSDVLPQFEANLTALRRAYELGEIDIVGLAGGRERFLEAQRDALAAQEDYFTALAELEHAVGVDVLDAHQETK